MTYPPVAMRRVAGYDDLSEPAVPGEFYFQRSDGLPDYLALAFICAKGCFHSVPVLGNTPSWTWDGNEETPTLAPSIRDLSHCRWHGFVRAGVLETCGDTP